MPSCPDNIKKLVERFNQQSDTVSLPSYNETNLRVDYINPFMRELGWDIDNSKGYAEQYREVVHEDRVKVSGQTKAPDYSFRIGGQRKFFLEAKKPAVNIKKNKEPAYQLRRYAWSAKLACSILTDFEEFAIYDTRKRPKQFDTAAVARREYIHYTEYEERWEFIYETFSREAVLKGDFDRYCGSKKGRGAEEFDEAFLAEIEEWRKKLASTLARLNDDLDESALNFAVQRIIDRIIFLRIAEDRGTEPKDQLKDIFKHSDYYRELASLFTRADERYNSGLFHFEQEKGREEQPDTLTRSLKVDNKTLKSIIEDLYYPQSPYEFSVVSADILGSVYERFLGKVIELTPGHRARIVEKPEVRKAGGVYYTPPYIVDYIVKNTVGELLKDKSASQARKIKVLDPACGSGSFLIGAYQFLLDWYLEQHTSGDPEKKARQANAVIRPGPAGGWMLTIAERKRILLDHIHGVDIDAQAVEVAKLNLLLKCLEGETSETLGFTGGALFHKNRALPDLGRNIQCGNSLIGTEIIGTEAWEEMDEREHIRTNPFDYERAFPQVFSGNDPGFDATIGNPPWGGRLTLPIRNYLARYSEVADFETSQYFLHRLKDWANRKGISSMIIPNTFFLNVYAKRARDHLFAHGSVLHAIDLSELNVFLGPNVRSAILIWTPEAQDEMACSSWSNSEAGPLQLRAVPATEVLAVDTWSGYFERQGEVQSLVRRLTSTMPTADTLAHVRQGYIPYRTSTLERRHGAEKAKYIVKNRTFHSRERVDESCLRELQGKDVCRYRLAWSGVWVKYGDWVSTYIPVNDVFSGERVLIREITGKVPHRIYACLTDEIYVHNPSVLSVVPKNNVSAAALSGVLNSRLMSVIFASVAPKAKKGLFPKIIITDARRLPVPENFEDNQGELEVYVRTMTSLLDRHATAKNPNHREQLQREIDATDRQIDQLVYELYGLTEDEIRIVEEATA